MAIICEEKPLVSFLVTAYNCENYLEDTLRSLMAQTFSNIEIIVVEDGSTDNTKIILQQVSEQDERIKPYFPGRVGRAIALNIGLKNCKGKYIAINDADDFSKPNRVEKQLEFLENHPSIGLLGSWKEIHENGEISIDEKPINDSDIRMAFAYGQPIQHSSVMFRAEVLKKVGGYNEKIPFLLDRDIFLRVAKHTSLYQLPEPLIILNRSDQQYFKNKYKGLKRIWLSTRYQVKAIYQFKLPFRLYGVVVARFFYSAALSTYRSNILNGHLV